MFINYPQRVWGLLDILLCLSRIFDFTLSGTLLLVETFLPGLQWCGTCCHGLWTHGTRRGHHWLLRASLVVGIELAVGAVSGLNSLRHFAILFSPSF